MNESLKYKSKLFIITYPLRQQFFDPFDLYKYKFKFFYKGINFKL